MLKTYRSLLSIPHARAFVLAGFVARLSISMRALGAVLMISQLTGSYGLAGAVAAAALLGEAVAAPRLGRLVDRYGQRRVLFLSLVVHSIGTLALVISAQLSAPNWVLLASAALSGAAALQVGSLVRARWSALVGGSPVLEAAFALESTLDELIFVLGPALVTALALGVAPNRAARCTFLYYRRFACAGAPTSYGTSSRRCAGPIGEVGHQHTGAAGTGRDLRRRRSDLRYLGRSNGRVHRPGRRSRRGRSAARARRRGQPRGEA